MHRLLDQFSARFAIRELYFVALTVFLSICAAMFQASAHGARDGEAGRVACEKKLFLAAALVVRQHVPHCESTALPRIHRVSCPRHKYQDHYRHR